MEPIATTSLGHLRGRIEHVANDPFGTERRAWNDVPSASPVMKSFFL